MFSSLPFKCIDFFPPPYASQLLPQRPEILDDRILSNVQSFSVQFEPMIRRVFHRGFHTISLLIQAPRKTNDREGICEHNSQLSLNCTHIFLCFLLLATHCHCTLTWKWSCHWIAQVHTVGLTLDFESLRGSPTLWFLWIFSTRTPSAFHRFESIPWGSFSANKIQ